jgi:hypothetical protein
MLERTEHTDKNRKKKGTGKAIIAHLENTLNEGDRGKEKT